MAQCLRVITVGKRSHNHQPIPCGDISSKTAVFIRAHVEPLVVGFVVQQEIVSNAFVAGVEEGSRNEIRVLQRNFHGVLNGVQTDSDGIKEFLTDQVVISCIFIACPGPVKHEVVPAGRQGNRDDSRLGVVVGGVVEAFSVFINGL